MKTTTMDEHKLESILDAFLETLNNIDEDLLTLNSTLQRFRNGSYYGPSDTDLQI